MEFIRLQQYSKKIYDTGEIPQDISKSIFITLPKKSDTTEPILHRTISVKSHIIKILSRIIMMQVRNKIKPEIVEKQCGSEGGKGTTNEIYTLRIHLNELWKYKKKVYLCFINYNKAVNRVRHGEIIAQLTQLKIKGNDLCMSH